MVDGVGEWFGERTMAPEGQPPQHTQYRSRSLRQVYEFQGYSPWSDWQSQRPSVAMWDELETRYRSRSRTETVGAWSAWQEVPFEEEEGVRIAERTVYRYRETG
jgi:isocitrate lyase